MTHNARIEEVPDTDSDSDPSEFDPSDFDPTTIIRPTSTSTSTSSKPRSTQTPIANPPSPPIPTAKKEYYRHWQSLYAVYFDATRSRAEGRRIGKTLAVENPLAREIADAVQGLGYNVVLEPGKMHPKDWANPGRVRVQLKDEAGRVNRGRVKNKHHLYILVAAYLRTHPATPETPFRAGMRIAGMPIPDKPPPPPAVPRGWKIGSILPLHSPALSGGGVSENIFKDMMQEMSGGAGPAGMLGELGGSGEGKLKKPKRK